MEEVQKKLWWFLFEYLQSIYFSRHVFRPVLHENSVFVENKGSKRDGIWAVDLVSCGQGEKQSADHRYWPQDTVCWMRR